jgi:hypothetical protein
MACWPEACYRDNLGGDSRETQTYDRILDEGPIVHDQYLVRCDVVWYYQEGLSAIAELYSEWVSELVCRSGEDRLIPKFRAARAHFADFDPVGSLPFWTRYMLIDGSTAGLVIHADRAVM